MHVQHHILEATYPRNNKLVFAMMVIVVRNVSLMSAWRVERHALATESVTLLGLKQNANVMKDTLVNIVKSHVIIIAKDRTHMVVLCI